MIDSHAHVFGKKFEDIPEVIEAFSNEGGEKIIMPNIDSSSIDDMLEVEDKFPSICKPAMGLHPTSVNKQFEKELYIVEDWIGKRSFSAIGEIGTDLYWDDTFWEEQKEAFKIQCGFALKYDLPVIIHCRESIDQTIELIEEIGNTNLTGVFHCFGGNVDQALKIKEMGFYLGIGGVITFKNSTLAEVVSEIGMDKLLLETDSPYLAPVPKRGKRNIPSYLTYIVEAIANATKKSNEEVIGLTTKNAVELFGLV